MVLDEIEKLTAFDPEVGEAIRAEYDRQRGGLELIASENVVSDAVMLAAGSILTNKYAEGYPDHRYYGGCACVDRVEKTAIERAKQLFGAEHVNVQPHSGAQANTAVYVGLLEHGDTVMGMNLAHGGHLTHGSPVNFSGKNYNFVAYGVDRETGRIDYAEFERLAHEHKPKLIIAGASAYPRIIDFERMASVAHAVGALFMVDMAHIAGLVAAGLHPSPVPYADIVTTTTHKTLRGPRGGVIFCRPDLEKKINSAVFPGMQGGPLMHVIAAKAVAFGEALRPEFKTYQQQVVRNARALAETLQERGLRIVSGGTESHVMLVDLRPLGVTGKAAEALLHAASITVNKNAIPNDPEKPFVTSGIRLGTPAVTTRGFGEAQTREVGGLIVDLLEAPDDAQRLARVRERALALSRAFPVYGELV